MERPGHNGDVMRISTVPCLVQRQAQGLIHSTAGREGQETRLKWGEGRPLNNEPVKIYAVCTLSEVGTSVTWIKQSWRAPVYYTTSRLCHGGACISAVVHQSQVRWCCANSQSYFKDSLFLWFQDNGREYRNSYSSCPPFSHLSLPASILKFSFYT